MNHWKAVLDLPMFDINYADLVENQEASSRELITFCDLDCDERCLTFYNTKRTVATASYDQVRRPIYRDALCRCTHYATDLEPL